MARSSRRFVCQSCGTPYFKWQGFCAACGSDNSIVEERAVSGSRGGRNKATPIAFTTLDSKSETVARLHSGIGELDRVLGEGLVPGSVVLVGGDPGIGKSTLLLQAAARWAAGGIPTAYISGEEATAQIGMRAARLGLDAPQLRIAAATEVGEILAGLNEEPRPRIAIIDSIQTMFSDGLDSAPGTVAQVRASAHAFVEHAKRNECSIVLVGHVTKDGQIAGPRVVEHMVDAVLYFEGDRGHQFRILRGVKNRFGPTDEIGVFEMTDKGLMEVSNPSSLFLGEREGEASGGAVFAGIEGSRPLLVEIQALAAPSQQATPRRAVVGWDSGRLAMIIAVLETRCGLAVGGNEIYLNVAGGLRIGEPAADLAVAAALMSSLSDLPVPAGTVIFGEIGLSGEVRPVGQTDARIREARKLGFNRVVLPAGGRYTKTDMDIVEIDHLRDLLAWFATRGADNLLEHG